MKKQNLTADCLPVAKIICLINHVSSQLVVKINPDFVAIGLPLMHSLRKVQGIVWLEEKVSAHHIMDIPTDISVHVLAIDIR